MNQYLLSVYSVDGAAVPSETEMAKIFKDVEVFNEKVRDRGHWVFAGGLHPHTTATTVQVKDGETVTTDGPFTEGKEHIGGFWVIKAKDLDEALSLAREATVACAAPVEVRPFQDEAES